jgi:hypothetical protein
MILLALLSTGRREEERNFQAEVGGAVLHWVHSGQVVDEGRIDLERVACQTVAVYMQGALVDHRRVSDKPVAVGGTLQAVYW